MRILYSTKLAEMLTSHVPYIKEEMMLLDKALCEMIETS